MAIFVGVALARPDSLFAKLVGLDRNRAFHPTVLIIVVSYNGIFAVVGGSAPALGVERVATVLFLGATVAGFRWNLWIVAGSPIAHGLFDFVYRRLNINPGVSNRWPAFCPSYDVAAELCVAGFLQRGALRASADAWRA